jgi:hypothetical protein
MSLLLPSLLLLLLLPNYLLQLLMALTCLLANVAVAKIFIAIAQFYYAFLREL